MGGVRRSGAGGSAMHADGGGGARLSLLGDAGEDPEQVGEAVEVRDQDALADGAVVAA